MTDHALIVGRFMPPHKGHDLLVQTALAEVQSVTVLVTAKPGDAIPGALRAQWLGGANPAATVLHVPHDLATDYDSEAAWARWMDLYSAALAAAGRPAPTAVYSSEAYGAGIAERLGCRHRLVDLDRVAVPISATAIRTDWRRNAAFLHEPARAWMAANWPEPARRLPQPRP